MKAKRFFLGLLGTILILASFIPVVLIVSGIQGELSGGPAAIVVGLLLLAFFLWLAVRCFRAVRSLAPTKPVKIAREPGFSQAFEDFQSVDPDTALSDATPDPAYFAPPAKPSFMDNFRVDFAVIANSSNRTKAGSAITRGAVGGLLLGPIGLLAAASAKKNSYIDLIVHYKSGRVSTQRVKVNSLEYYNLAKYIRG